MTPPTDWQETTLGEIIDIKHGWAFKGEHFSIEPTEHILLTPGNFCIGGGFRAGKFKYYDGEYPPEYVLNKDDVIVTMTDLSKNGDTLGYPAKVPGGSKKYLHNQRLGLVIFNGKNALRDFIYWKMRTKEYQKFIVNSASGSTVRHTSPSKILEFSFKMPPLEEQKKIASILSALDDKISLLRRQNETLEQIAQEIFRHWFVDFEFPDEHGKPYKSSGGRFVSSELGDIPEDWESVNFFDEFELLSGGTPKTSVSEYWDGEIRWISAKDVTPHHRRFILDSEKKITEPGVANSAAKMLPPYTVVISARGTVGNFCIIPEEMCISQSNYGIKAKKPNRNCLTYLYISHLIHQLKKQAYGSVFDTITSYTFRDLDIVVPGEGLAEEFENLVLPFFKKMLANEKGIQSLMSIRDTLMPKLMNGEIRTN